jgi:PAS domain S-box-containing protein
MALFEGHSRREILNYAVIGFLFFTILIAELSVYLFSGSALFVLSHLFYFPIIFLAYEFPRRGAIISVILAFAFLGLTYPFILPNILEIVPTTIQFYVYVSVGIAVTFISGEMRLSELKYRSIFSGSGSGICIMDRRTGEIHEENPQCARIIGMPGLASLFPDEASSDAFFERLDADGTVTDYELELVEKGGAPRHLLLSAGHLPNDQIVLTVTDITSRKQEEDLLRRSEASFRELAEELPLPIFEIDRKTRFSFVNRTALEKYGYTATEVAGGMSALETLVPEERGAAAEEISRLIQGSRAASREFTALKRDGATFPVLIHSTPIYREGSVQGIRGVIIDLSDRKRADEQIKENIQNLEFLARSAAEFVELGRDADLYRYISDQLARLVPGSINTVAEISGELLTVRAYSGITGEEVEVLDRHGAREILSMTYTIDPGSLSSMGSGKLVSIPGGLVDITFGRLTQEEAEALEREAEIEAIWGAGFTWKGDLYGNAIIALRKGTALPHPNLINAFIRQAAVALQRKNVDDTLRESEEKYRILFESSSDGIVLFKDHVVDCNYCLCEMLGYSKEEIMGRNVADFAPFVQPDRRDSHAASEKYFQAAREGIPQHFEWRFQRNDGSWLDTEVYLQAFTFRGEQYLYAILHDVTETKQAERALREANQKLSLLSSLTRHDLLNQVTGLLGYLALSEDATTLEEVEPFLDKMRGITSNIQGVLEFTRDYEMMGLEAPRWQKVAHVAAKASSYFSKKAVEFEIATGPLEIFADPLLEKVFFNLFDNAIRHGEHVSRISISFFTREDGGVLVVEDNGIGVPRSKKDGIFRRGFGKNTGLGLFLTKKALSMTGIAVRETGEEGQGARFEILIPPDRYRLS